MLKNVFICVIFKSVIINKVGEKSMKKAPKRRKAFKAVAIALISVAMVIVLGITNVVPYFAVIPDMVKVGLDYITLKRDKNSVSESELLENLRSLQNTPHPFVIATKAEFDTVRTELQNNTFTDYTENLYLSAIANADALLDKSVYPVLAYELDEEDSILPISREVINRLIILGYAWQVTGDEKYARRAWEEAENICNYPDWCTGHFLATAEMALAASIAYDWFFDYLNEEQKSLLSSTAWEYAIEPAINGNHWFTWSKNNWNSICYSGIGIACMSFAEQDEEKATQFLAKCFRNMPIAFENFTPDGVYAEGPGYCQSGMNAIVYYIATSRNFFGSDFGMADIDGFKKLGYFPVYITTPTGMFNFGDNKAEQCFTPVLHWYANELNAPVLCAYQMNDMPEAFTPDTSENTERNGGGKENALSSLWYNRDYGKVTSFDGEPLCVQLESDVGQELVLMRSAYLQDDATFAAIKGGYNFINHGDLDIGTFVFDSMGERWAEELGPGAYDAPGYFLNTPAGGRWKNYPKRAEGQNTLVINPNATLDDQYVLAECGFESFSENENGGTAVLNMTDAYRMNGASEVTREFTLYNNYTCLSVSDKVKCIVPSDIYWFMHTKAQIEITENGKEAILTINGKKLKATLTGDGTFSVMKPEKLKGKYEYDADYDGISKLTVHLENVKSADITVKFEPVK